MPDPHESDLNDARGGDAADLASVERLLGVWAKAQAPAPDLSARVFEASRRSIAARRSARPSMGERLADLLSLFSPPRLALAAVLLAALAVPSVLLLDAPTSGPSDLGVAWAPQAAPVEPDLLGEAPVAEPLLVAMFDSADADWSDVLGDEHGVAILSVIETRGRGLDDYAAEFDAILGAFGAAPLGM